MPTMSSLPPEVADMICQRAQQTDIPSLRLLSHFWHGVATRHYCKNVKLYFKQDSFHRVLNIGAHTDWSRNVTTLLYQPDTLEIKDQETWDRDFKFDFLSCLIPNKFKVPSVEASGEDWRNFTRDTSRLCAGEHDFTARLDTETAWGIYQRYVLEQDLLWKDDCAQQEMRLILGRCSHLSHIEMNYGGGLYTSPKHPFTGAYCVPKSNLTIGDDKMPNSIEHMLTLMSAIYFSKRELKTLRVGFVSWQFFERLRSDADHMKMIGEIVSSLTTLHFAIAIGPPDDEAEDADWELDECVDTMKSQILGDVIAQAPNLTNLTIEFDRHRPYCPIDLPDLLLNTHWPHLRSFTLCCADIEDEEPLLEFSERHASTLVEISFGTLVLVKGRWEKVLTRMRKMLRLSSARFTKYLMSQDPSRFWDFSTPPHTAMKMQDHRGEQTESTLEKWMVREVGGRCPLLDRDKYPIVRMEELED